MLVSLSIHSATPSSDAQSPSSVCRAFNLSSTTWLTSPDGCRGGIWSTRGTSQPFSADSSLMASMAVPSNSATVMWCFWAVTLRAASTVCCIISSVSFRSLLTLVESSSSPAPPVCVWFSLHIHSIGSVAASLECTIAVSVEASARTSTSSTATPSPPCCCRTNTAQCLSMSLRYATALALMDSAMLSMRAMLMGWSPSRITPRMSRTNTRKRPFLLIQCLSRWWPLSFSSAFFSCTTTRNSSIVSPSSSRDESVAILSYDLKTSAAGMAR
mmetsp:Transcript_37118/g.93153  ORF Transcript_37118/g.93153 Transcript_37118/m.93153 type:complete len:271 (+) Transcript_37118:2306-3118(+)